MANEKIGRGANRRQLRHAPWWATDRKHIIGFSVGIVILVKVMSNLMTWGITRLIGYGYSTYQGFAKNPVLRISPLMRQWQHQPLNIRVILNIGLPPGGWIAWLSLIIWAAVAVVAIARMTLVYRSYNTLEHGAETFATISDIKRTYQVVPDRVAQFDGVGGVPISHFNNAYGSALHWLLAHKWVPGSQSLVKVFQNGTFPTGQYAIDTATNNTLGIGITRSGKGETFGLPTIDLLSRAKKRSSLIVNDPKRELTNLSQAMLRERGYRVMVLDLQSMANSMGYNPLTVIVDYARKGNWSKVQMETNRLSTAIYVKEGQSNSNGAFFDNSSVNLLNALILAQIDLAYRHHSWEKVSLHNVYEMMTDLGGRQITVTDANGKPIGQVSALTEYFNKMRELNDKNTALADEDGSQEVRRLALDAFAQSKFAGSETAGSIYASMMEGIKIYQQRDLAQLTAQSSFDVREAGFPRWLSLQLPSELANQPANVAIFETNKAGKRIKKIESRPAQIDEVGWLEYPINHQIPAYFMIQVQLPTEVLVQPIVLLGHKQVGLKGKTTVRLETAPKPVMSATLHYSEQPVALFLVTPPDNPSYNQIVSFFLDQSFNQLYGMATASGGQTFTRVHYLLDEFGNLPKVAHMDTKISIGLGQNILFTLIVQNLSQLRINYTEEQAQTIESNCANTVYILTKELKTAETISKSLGETTINSFQHRGKDVLEDFGNSSNSGVALMTPAELMRLNVGESVVLRTTRNSLTGADVRNNAIFNRGKTRMPFRWQFLSQTFHVDNGRLRSLEASPMQINLQQRGYQYMDEYERLEGAADLTPFDEGLQVETTVPSNETKTSHILGLTQSEWAGLNDQDAHNQLNQLLQKMVQMGVPQELVGLVSQAFHEDIRAALMAVQEQWQELQQYEL
ncbi:VirD4-like conjugal transfer protein, CD1115 family [uncultured Secundilactobacillus sp.]|uniref:VirD4-like conjugal transfer protein, CD1115 family n=1 Tax=uncultured Secundilactobacillus sp. TaxID=2813935 RepID=UPI00258FD46F|nr:type IV secretory system conjugative DNA transfer family protein [uncultured Secundilactobacillus sp.]